MKLATLFTVVLFHAACILFQTASAKEEIASVAKTASTFQRTFLKIASKSTSAGRSSRGRKVPPSPVELLFIIDRSGSIGRRNFALSLRFVQELTRYFSVSPSTTRVAAISYATTVKTEFQFNTYLNRECLSSAIKRIRYTGGATATGPALQQAINLFKSARPSAKKVIFFLTDGRSNRGVKPSIPAAQLRNSGVEIFALGIGYSVNVHELKSIASSNDDVFRVRNFHDLQRLIWALKQKPRDVCRGWGVRYDECNRRCSCFYGKLHNCCRVRKDFPSMSTVEKERYVSAYVTITTKQPYKAKYDRLVTIHRQFFDTPIHEQEEFLPWHRWYLLQLENLLREVDCRITMPYWDWSLWSHDPWSANAIWSPVGNRGLGGNGDPSRGYCVTTGPFRTPVWQTSRGQCLRRHFLGMVPDAAQVQFCLNIGPFRDFEIFLRVNLHNLVHVLIGGFFGQMSFDVSANAPEFALHHCFVDKIWHDWQAKSSANFNAYFPSINKRMTATPYYPRDFIDLQKQPGCVKVCYDHPYANSGRSVLAFLRSLSITQLQQLRRSPFALVTKRVNELFKTTTYDRTRAKQMEMKARGNMAKSSETVQLSSVLDRIIGFKTKIINRQTLAIRPLRKSDSSRKDAEESAKDDAEKTTQQDSEQDLEDQNVNNFEDFVEENAEESTTEQDSEQNDNLQEDIADNKTEEDINEDDETDAADATRDLNEPTDKEDEDKVNDKVEKGDEDEDEAYVEDYIEKNEI